MERFLYIELTNYEKMEKVQSDIHKNSVPIINNKRQCTMLVFNYS